MRYQSRVVIWAVGLFLVGTASLQAGEHEDSWVPDLTGLWSSEVIGYVFEDVADPGDEPFLYEGSLDYPLAITDQTGRVFTGKLNGAKLTGVILPNRTISIQYFELSEERIFITGRLTRSGNTLQISGYMHFFDDLRAGGDRMMATGFIRLTRED